MPTLSVTDPLEDLQTVISCQVVFLQKATELFPGYGGVRWRTTHQLLGFMSVCTPSQILYFSDRSLLAFRIEWSKARARSERWREEVLILREEMRRILVYLDRFSDEWAARGGPSSLLLLSCDPIIREGLTAYAEYQSHTFSSLRRRFHSLWSGLQKEDDPLTEPVSVASEEALLELQGGDI